MKLERTFIKEGMEIRYCLTDNKCSICRHNPKNRNPYIKGRDGNCKMSDESVVECDYFEKQ